MNEHLSYEEKLKLGISYIDDELIIEAPQWESEKAKEILENCMVKAAELTVPLLAESGTGKSWYDAH